MIEGGAMANDKKYVIFDLDGTLADITKRRNKATKPNGKIDWNIFFDPSLIYLDNPNYPVIDTAKSLNKSGYTIILAFLVLILLPENIIINLDIL